VNQSLRGSSSLNTAQIAPGTPGDDQPERSPRLPIESRHVIVVCVLLAEVLSLIWWFPYLPMSDLSEHMLAAQVLIHHDSPEYARFFTTHFPWNPYSSYFLFVLMVNPLIGVGAATRLYLSTAFVLTLVSLWWWIRIAAPGHDPQVIPSSLLLFGHFFYTGLINFLFSAPFLFFALVLSLKIMQRKQLNKTLCLALSLCILIAYLSHVVTFGLCCLLIAGQALSAFSWRRIRWLLISAAPSFFLLMVYALTQARSDVARMTLSWDPLAERFAPFLLPINIFRDWLPNRWVFDRPSLTWWILVALLTIGGIVKSRFARNQSINQSINAFGMANDADAHGQRRFAAVQSLGRAGSRVSRSIFCGVLYRGALTRGLGSLPADSLGHDWDMCVGSNGNGISVNDL
jgi:hypothetical protein